MADFLEDKRPEKLERAFLVGVQTADMADGEGAELLLELQELVENLRLTVTRSTLVNLRTPTPKFLLGSGKAQELVEQAKAALAAAGYGGEKIVQVSPADYPNVKAASEVLADMLKNAECASIIHVIGGGSGRTFNLDDVRYGKIIVLADADVDGAHIRCLLLTLMYRYMRPMLDAGRVFAAIPPLHRIETIGGGGKKGEYIYTYSDDEMKKAYESEYGPQVRMPHTKAMGDGLFEMRPQGRDGIGRVFYCYVKGKKIIILHSFIKKTQKTPQKELQLARKRLHEVQ